MYSSTTLDSYLRSIQFHSHSVSKNRYVISMYKTEDFITYKYVCNVIPFNPIDKKHISASQVRRELCIDKYTK